MPPKRIGLPLRTLSDFFSSILDISSQDSTPLLFLPFFVIPCYVALVKGILLFNILPTNIITKT